MTADQCTKCKRTDAAAGELVRTAGRSLLCRECFRDYVRRRHFGSVDAWRRESGQKYHRPHHDDDDDMRSMPRRSVLVPVSGGPSSAVLAWLLHDSCERTRGHAPRPILLHLDDTQYTGEAREALDRTLDWLERTCIGTKLIRRSINGEDAAAAAADGAFDTLGTTLASLRSKTSQEDLLEQQRSIIYRRVARELDCSAILLGDSATRLAARALSLTAQGRGERLAEDVAETTRIRGAQPELWLLRPNKRLLLNELRAFARQLGVPLAEQRDDAAVRPDSIDALTRQYFADLEEQFPSLVNTVARITDKLVRADAAGDETTPCVFCGTVVMADGDVWWNGAAANGHELTSDSTAKDINQPSLCYGCRVTFADATQPVDWSFILAARQRLNEAHRRGIVAEFELGDDD